MDRLFVEAYCDERLDLAEFVETNLNFLKLYLGDIRQAVVHSDQISKLDKVIYNQEAWDSEKFKDVKEGGAKINHREVVKEILNRMQKYTATKIDAGFISNWKNPYQIGDTSLPMSVSISYEKQEGTIFMRSSFFNPDNWFSLQCQPLFKTDALVIKDPNAPWNMNAVGLISPKNEKCTLNRRNMFNMFTDFIKEFSPNFAVLSYSQFYYNPRTDVAYIIAPNAKNDSSLLPIVYHISGTGKILYSDSSEISITNYKTTTVKEFEVTYNRDFFDFLP